MANPTPDFPGAIHTPTDTSGFGSSGLGATTPTHTQVEGKQEEELAAIQQKMGSGASTPTDGKVLKGTGNGTSAWQDEVSGGVSSVNGQTGVVVLTKSDVGLGNADNTSDASKPVSTATQTALDTKVDKNAGITGATKTKITYDAKGLVTAGADATTADIADSTDKRYITDAQRTVVGNTTGVNSGDQVLPVKATGAEVDTGTDDAKFVTAKAVEDSSYVKAAYADAKVADAINDGTTTVAPSQNAVFDALALKIATSTLDTDGALAANSDLKIATQKAVKTYADALIGANDALVYKGVIDASGNPNYPAASAGHLYKISVAGKIGGGSGTNVEVGDSILCLIDSTASGTQASVGANWNVIQVNLDGAVIGPASSTDNAIVRYDSTTGKLIQNSAATIDDSGNIAGNNLSGTNTGDQTTVSGNAGSATVLQTSRNIDGVGFNGSADILVIAPGTHAATGKTTPVDADELPLVDSAASNVLKKLTWANLKATLKTYFDGLYQAVGSYLALSGGTMAGNITLGENTSIALDPAGSADGKYSGITITGTAGATMAFGDIIVLDVTASKWLLADANSAAAADGDARGLIGICVLASTDTNPTTILLLGTIRADAKFPALTITAPVYLSETAGAIVVAQPTTTDVVIRTLGNALTADEILFNPSPDYITHT